MQGVCVYMCTCMCACECVGGGGASWVYEIVSKLGFFAGAFGKVFRGEMRRIESSKFEDIAIKTIKSELHLFLSLLILYNYTTQT